MRIFRINSRQYTQHESNNQAQKHEIKSNKLCVAKMGIRITKIVSEKMTVFLSHHIAQITHHTKLPFNLREIAWQSHTIASQRETK